MKRIILVFFSIFLFSETSFGKKWIVIYSKELHVTPRQYPHVFAQFYSEDLNTKKPTKGESYGFAPIEIGDMFGDGDIHDEANTAKELSCCIEVSDKEYNLCLSIVGKWRKKYYSLPLNNCVAFIREMLSYVKIIEMPPREYLVPTEFVQMLKVLNQVWEEHSILSYNFSMNKQPITPAVIGNKSFKINPKDVTLSTDKEFKWYDWEEAPEDIKTASKYLKMHESESMFDLIKDYLDGGCNIYIALIDLDNDGIAGLVFQTEHCNYGCGTGGCTFRLYDNGGFRMVDLGLDKEVEPSKNGVISSKGIFFPIKRNTKISGNETGINKLFSYNKPKPEITPVPVVEGQPVGGITPEQLGQMLLKALKTNDKKLWISCFAPKEVWTQEYQKIYATGESHYSNKLKMYTSQFEYLRNKLEERGFSNFANIKFSRVIFKREQNKDDDAISDEELLIRYFYVEFTYGTEFIGRIGDNAIATYKRGNYFVISQGGLLESARH